MGLRIVTRCSCSRRREARFYAKDCYAFLFVPRPIAIYVKDLANIALDGQVLTSSVSPNIKWLSHPHGKLRRCTTEKLFRSISANCLTPTRNVAVA